ncbi:hypothetical protein V5O48_016853 [Marasmius crinis-equi]|uniref:DUF659 domain-containing protein n=1 Tax=Marasmius crinis-equi TaxID=585013 RepID=A0ABR3EQP3_9AGAR
MHKTANAQDKLPKPDAKPKLTTKAKKPLVQQAFQVTNSKPFGPQKQSDFERDFMKLWVTTNGAFYLASHPFVEYFCNKWIPGSKLPGRNQLGGCILDAECGDIMKDILKEVVGEYGTGVIDGWSTKKDAVQHTNLNVQGSEYPVNLHVTAPERKTSANLLTHVLTDMKTMTMVWKAVVVAWCCDSGGDSRGLCPLLLKDMPWLITIPCWAHQINLTVKDYLTKGNPYIVLVLGTSLTLINWFKAHKRAESILFEEQRNNPNLGAPVGFVRPGMTCWGSHFMSCCRLLELMKPLKSTLNNREELCRAAGDKKEQIEQANLELRVANRFNRIKVYLEPLAVAGLVAQGSSTRLNHVLVTLATLYHCYSTKTKLYKFTEDNKIILGSLQKHWEVLKRDQDNYIVAVFLNPFLCGFYFNADIASLSWMGLYSVVKRVYMRVFRVDLPEDVPDELFDHFIDYYDKKGALSEWLKHFFKTGKTYNEMHLMSQVWRGGPSKSPLTKLALLIMSIVANSAGAECHFSTMGRLYSDKRRNLLNPVRAHKIAVVNRSIQEQFPQKESRKRDTTAIRNTTATSSSTTNKDDNDNDDESSDSDEDSKDRDASSARPLIDKLNTMEEEDSREEDNPFDAPR